MKFSHTTTSSYLQQLKNSRVFCQSGLQEQGPNIMWHTLGKCKHHHSCHGITLFLCWWQKSMCWDSVSTFVLGFQNENSMWLWFSQPCHSFDNLYIFYLQLCCANTWWMLLLFLEEPCVFMCSTCLVVVINSPHSLTSHSTSPYVFRSDGTGGEGRRRIMLWVHLSILIAISYTLFIKYKIVPRGTKAASWMDEGGAAFFTCNRKWSSQTMYSVERASFWKH